MKKFRAIILLAFALMFTASLGFSQGTGDSNASNNSQQNQNVTVLGSGSGSAASAVSGVFGQPGPFPGYIVPDDTRRVYAPAMYQSGITVGFCKSVMKKAHVWGGFDKLEALPDNEDPIHLLNWNLEVTAWPKDQPIGLYNAEAKNPNEPWDATLCRALMEAKEKTHTKRVWVLISFHRRNVTKGLSIGSGGSNSIISGPGKNNDITGVAAGGLIGKNSVEQDKYPFFEVYALNDGPIEPTDEWKKLSQRAAQPQQAPNPTFTFRFEGTPPTAPPPQQAPAAQQQAPAPAAAAPQVIPCATLPKVIVYFGYDRSDLLPEDADATRTIGEWMRNNSTCKLTIEGYASSEGSNEYNEHLAEMRAINTEKALASQFPDVADRIVRELSGGKRFATHLVSGRGHSATRDDRKAIFVIRNITSE